MKRVITSMFLVFFALGLTAQDSGEDELGSWHMIFSTLRMTNKLSIHAEGQLRYYEAGKNFNQLLLRTGLNYHINPNAIGTFGYGFIDTDSAFEEFPEEENIKEHRLFEQFILKNKVWELGFEHRYRLEQRFLDFGSNGGTDVQHRVRYRLQVTLPLTDTFFLNFYDEVFLNLQNNVFGQNRLYAAVGLNITDNLSVQSGYLKNHFNNANFDRLQVAVFYNPDFRKK